MFVDELNIYATAGKGGDGVERWLRLKNRPWGGPAGGNGGRGGDVLVRAVRNINQLAKYTGEKKFAAEDGDQGHGRSKSGKNGEDFIIDVPLGSKVTCTDLDRTFELFNEGEVVCILKGGRGGLGNEVFKSSTKQAPTDTTRGKLGERSNIVIELSLVVDVGFIGLPNAGKSTLLNALTNAQSRIGEYPFTTLEPHLGDLYGYTLADIPGLIEGAADGKGLGHKFLRHVSRTKMLLHCVALDNENIEKSYEVVRNEITQFDAALGERAEWIILTKADLVSSEVSESTARFFKKKGCVVHVVSENDTSAIKALSDSLTAHLRKTETDS